MFDATFKLKEMKQIGLLIILVGLGQEAWSCPVCERNQPKLFRGIVHGSGPDSSWDYVIVTLMTLISILTLIYAIKWLIRPGEKHSNHIKRTILKLEDYESEK